MVEDFHFWLFFLFPPIYDDTNPHCSANPSLFLERKPVADGFNFYFFQSSMGWQP